MIINFSVTENINSVNISLYSTDLGTDNNINAVQIVNKSQIEEIKKIMTKEQFAFQICYIVVKEFQHEINKKLMIAATIISDEELKDKIVTWGKKIMTSEIEIINSDLFNNLYGEVIKVLK